MSIKTIKVAGLERSQRLQRDVRRAMASLGMRLLVAGKHYVPGQSDKASDSMEQAILSCVERYYGNREQASGEDILYQLVRSALVSERSK